MPGTENKAPQTLPSEFKVMIATPSYNGDCSMGYAISLLKTYAASKEVSRLKLVHQHIPNDSCVARARNFLAATMMRDPSITHMLFIDADMSWEAEDVLRLIMADKPIIGAAIPMKKYKWDRLKHDKVKALLNDAKISKEEFERLIKMHLLDYAVNLSENLETQNGTLEVKNISTAFMLIKRHVFVDMIKAYPQKKINNVPDGFPREFADTLYAFFDQENFDGTYLSTSYSFCKRYKDIGGKIFADLSITVGHVGAENYVGNLFEVAKVPKRVN